MSVKNNIETAYNAVFDAWHELAAKTQPGGQDWAEFKELFVLGLRLQNLAEHFGK